MVWLMRSLPTHGLRSRVLRRLRDERGIALIMALGIMFVLTIALGTTIFLTAAAARDAHRTNAGQKAYAFAEAGLNNAIAVLNTNYPGTTIYPGNGNLLLSTTLTSPVTTLPASTTVNVASTAGYNSGSNTISFGSSGAVTCTGITSTSFTGCIGGFAGTYPAGTVVARANSFGANSVAWYGSLVNVPTNPKWKWEWDLTAFGRVKNPTGPTADLVRKATAVVPVVIPDSTSVNPGTTSIDWVYGLGDVTFSNSVNVAARVYAGHDIKLLNSATIDETIPASLTLPAQKNVIAAEHDLNLGSPQNQVGHVHGTADPANDLGEIHVGNQCESQANPTGHACAWGATDKIWGVTHDSVMPTFTKPTLTCCSPIGSATPPNPSYMGFWYLNAGLGPKSPCATFTGTPLTFDTDNSINESVYSRSTPFDLTGAAYSCTSADGQTKLAWNGTTLTIKGTVFIDGSATSSSRVGKYVGKGTIILSGLYSMGNQTALCVNLASPSNCDTSANWDADTNALVIVADGVDASHLSTALPAPGTSISIQKGNFQGLLLGYGNIDASVAGTVVMGPIVSVYGVVNAGQTGTLQFPPITFASSGTDGLTGPLPLPQLLSPIQFGGG
jgi:Tfp pilus assembly protein PilX